MIKKDGFKREYYELIIDLCSSPPFLVYSSLRKQSEEIKEIFSFMLNSNFPLYRKIRLCLRLLDSRFLDTPSIIILYEKFLNSDKIPIEERKAISYAIVDRNIQYFAKFIKEEEIEEDFGIFEFFNAERDKELAYRINLTLEFPLSYSSSSIMRRSILWLAENGEDKNELIRKYFKEERIYDYYKVLGVLDLINKYKEEFGEKIVKEYIEKGINSSSAEIRRLSYKYGYENFGNEYLERAKNDKAKIVRELAKNLEK